MFDIITFLKVIYFISSQLACCCFSNLLLYSLYKENEGLDYLVVESLSFFQWSYAKYFKVPRELFLLPGIFPSVSLFLFLFHPYPITLCPLWQRLTSCLRKHFLFLSGHTARLHFPVPFQLSTAMLLSSGQWNMGRNDVHFI
jgi:hypothetical protein